MGMREDIEEALNDTRKAHSLIDEYVDVDAEGVLLRVRAELEEAAGWLADWLET